MSCFREPWVILFGGAGRQDVVLRLVAEGVPITSILAPNKASSKLESSIALLRKYDLDVVSISRADISDFLAMSKATNLLCIGFPYLIPKSAFSRFSLALNIHPTLLPKYRGPTSGAHILINNEEYAGATVHHLAEEADRGAVVLQSKTALSPFDTVRSMQRKVYATEPELIVRALRAIDDGTPSIPQDESMASEYPNRRRPEDSEIDPSLPLIELIRFIRASDEENFPAFFYFKGEKVCIKLWRPDKPFEEMDLI